MVLKISEDKDGGLTLRWRHGARSLELSFLPSEVWCVKADETPGKKRISDVVARALELSKALAWVQERA